MEALGEQRTLGLVIGRSKGSGALYKVPELFQIEHAERG